MAPKPISTMISTALCHSPSSHSSQNVSFHIPLIYSYPPQFTSLHIPFSLPPFLPSSLFPINHEVNRKSGPSVSSNWVASVRFQQRLTNLQHKWLVAPSFIFILLAIAAHPVIVNYKICRLSCTGSLIHYIH